MEDPEERRIKRADKIYEFMHTAWGGRRWCSGGPCACMGCINGSLCNQWHQQSNEEMPISKEEFFETLSKLPPENREPINLSFRFDNEGVLRRIEVTTV